MSAVVSNLNAPVLVLNRLWTAIRVTDARRAFSLLVRNLAEVIHTQDDNYNSYDFENWAELSQSWQEFEGQHYQKIHTPRMPLAVPKIIRLFGYDRLPKQGVKLNRRNIYARDKSLCQYCGGKFSTSELSLDHIKPRTQGGQSSWTNLVCSCVKCNARKGGRTPEQASMKLIRKPYKPKRNPAISIKLSTDRFACWQAFLDNAYWSVELK
ncbi:MAG: HNH endonuclease [Phycisphaeraceae bacterium]|nr:HNH endonuclease [Phycisphaeraceae bacterium]